MNKLETTTTITDQLGGKYLMAPPPNKIEVAKKPYFHGNLMRVLNVTTGECKVRYRSDRTGRVYDSAWMKHGEAIDYYYHNLTLAKGKEGK